MITAQTAFQLTNRLIDAYTTGLDKIVSARADHLVDDLSTGDLEVKARTLPERFRGIFEPFARDLYERQMALFLGGLYLAGQEDPRRIELQSPDISALFTARPGEALAFLLGKRVVTREEFDLLSAREQLRAFTVSRVAERRMLESIKQDIISRMVGGQSEKELIGRIRQSVPADAQRWVKTVVGQNLAQAAMAGRFEQMWRSRERRPYVQRKSMDDSRVRPAHAVLHNMIWRIEEVPSWPPDDFGCRCWMISLAPHQLPANATILSGPAEFSVDGQRVGYRPPGELGAGLTLEIDGQPHQIKLASAPARNREALDLANKFRKEIFRQQVFHDIPNNDPLDYKRFLKNVFPHEWREAQRAERAGEYFVYNASPTPLYSTPPSPGEMFVDVHQYTQNEHFLGSFIEKALDTGIKPDQIELRLKGSTMRGFEYPDSEEILRTVTPGIGEVSRTTEYVLRIRVERQPDLKRLAADLLDVAEKHGPRTIERRLTSEAWLQADVRIAGLDQETVADRRLADQWKLRENRKHTIFKKRWLYYKRVNDGEIVKIYAESPQERPDLIGPKAWDGAYPIHLNWNLAQLIRKPRRRRSP
jgi:SPP1 gp7 family putative phage head morphogenesis protein